MLRFGAVEFFDVGGVVAAYAEDLSGVVDVFEGHCREGSYVVVRGDFGGAWGILKILKIWKIVVVLGDLRFFK